MSVNTPDAGVTTLVVAQERPPKRASSDVRVVERLVFELG